MMKWKDYHDYRDDQNYYALVVKMTIIIKIIRPTIEPGLLCCIARLCDEESN